MLGTTRQARVDAAQRQGFDLPPLDARLPASLTRLPVDPLHREPFGRRLVWQALSQGYTLVSRDRKIASTSQDGLQILG
ncbi:MAG: hypothetical protein WCK08_01140 [Betaproteobacteria bacterium]